MTRHASAGSLTAELAAGAGSEARRRAALRAYWRSPARLVMLAAAGVALAVRCYLLSRPRYLTGITEYDDGVYLGGAVSLVSGVLPYQGFAFVQPPGILLLMAPVALLAKVSAVTTALAAARLLTVLASGAGVLLAGALVRHRGPLVTLVACGTLALYPDDVFTAHTLLLEPWMNALLLGGTRLAFQDGRLAAPRRLLWAGVLFGLAGAVKYWAALPALALLAVCLAVCLPGGGGRRRAARFAGGLAAGFAVPVLPFAAPWPGLFVGSTLLDQASRAGSAVPESLRLAHLTGLAAVLNDAGRLAVSGRQGTLFARGDVTAAATWADGWLPVAVAAVLAALLGLGFFARVPGAPAAPGTTGRRGPEALAWFALLTLGGTLAAVLGYSTFFYHYADLPAPWLAIVAGYAAGALSDRAARFRRPGAGRRRRRGARRLAAGLAAALLLVAGFEAWELSGSQAPDIRASAALLPPGGCVVSDEVSLLVAASRFTVGPPNCPHVLDSLAVTLVAGHGVSVQGGARGLPQVAAAWQAIFSRARYAWLSGSSDRRIPWTPGLRAWFARSFRPLSPPAGERGAGRLYVRR